VTLMFTQNDWRNYELYHHGILGQKWHIRHYQRNDGSLTREGIKRYGYASFTEKKRDWLRQRRLDMARRRDRVQQK